MAVVIEDDDIGSARRITGPCHPFSRSIQVDGIMSNLRRLPTAIRIAATKVRNLESALALCLDLIEQLDLIRRRTIRQHKNFHRVFACLNLMNKCDSPTHASTT